VQDAVSHFRVKATEQTGWHALIPTLTVATISLTTTPVANRPLRYTFTGGDFLIRLAIPMPFVEPLALTKGRLYTHSLHLLQHRLQVACRKSGYLTTQAFSRGKLLMSK
jgi:hypothetical protein